MGKNKETDFLAIGFSATDHIAHDYGSVSFEIEDTYIKLDSLLGVLLNAFDRQVGKGNYLLFLTADHAGIETPSYLKDQRVPVGQLNLKKFLESLKSFTLNSFDDEKLLENLSNSQIFLDRSVIKEKNLNIHEVEQRFKDYLRDNYPAIASIYSRDDLEKYNPSRESSNTILNGFNPALSGDIAYSLQPGYLPNFITKGTSHSTAYSYDTHVPLLFYGWHIPKQTNNSPVYIVDIAATIAKLLKIQEPSASIGIPLIK
jgi:arylsulfatase A-like enzyme